MIVEHTAMGVPTDAAITRRPTYGYCTGSCESHPNVIKYGDAILQLRRPVGHRTTFTFGDSLDEIALLSPQPPFCPSPLSRPTVLGLHSSFDALDDVPIWGLTRCGYVEAQIYGDVRPRDVEAITFTLGTYPSDIDQRHMADYGITWRTVDGDGHE